MGSSPEKEDSAAKEGRALVQNKYNTQKLSDNDEIFQEVSQDVLV